MSASLSLQPNISYVFVGETLTPVVVDDTPANPTSVPAMPNNAPANLNNAPANPHDATENHYNASENLDNTSLYSDSSSNVINSLEKAQKMPDMSALRPTGVKVNILSYNSKHSGSW
jgi:hypothetical protein